MQCNILRKIIANKLLLSIYLKTDLKKGVTGFKGVGCLGVEKIISWSYLNYRYCISSYSVNNRLAWGFG